MYQPAASLSCIHLPRENYNQSLQYDLLKTDSEFITINKIFLKTVRRKYPMLELGIKNSSNSFWNRKACNLALVYSSKVKLKNIINSSS